MPFTWSAFDATTQLRLALALGLEPDSKESPERYLTRVAPQPTAELVRATKSILEACWLPQYEGLEFIARQLRDRGIGPMGSPRTPQGYLRYIKACRNARTVQELIAEAMLRWGEASSDGPRTLDTDFVPRFAVLNLSQQKRDDRKPKVHQLEAWKKLDAALAVGEATGSMRGLLVMPTGSGKTYTAVRWLLEKVVAKGGRVLWIAHRDELLAQAAEQFHRLATFAGGRPQIRVRVVSSTHCAASTIRRDDDVVVASIQSLANRPDIQRSLSGQSEPFLVVDEAHHAPASSYRNLIRLFGADRRIRLLGLTATPTRTVSDERPILAQLFTDGVLHQVGCAELIARGILARPIPVRVQTEVRADEDITDEELAHIAQFRDLGSSLLDRIATLADRNRVIVDHYLKNRERYGKTLVFAINVLHAALLTEMLRERGVSADYVASYRPDGSEGVPSKLFREFRSGNLEVLVNVQIATEGVDVPDVQTVLLTRPTQSEILFRQMIGRALRGQAFGGTETAYIVSFEDHWEHFSNWLDPFELVPDVVVEEPLAEVVRIAIEQTSIPWEAIQEVAKLAANLREPQKAEAFEAIPYGWYLLERDTGSDEEASLHAVLVYEHQVPCWEAFFDALYARRRQDFSQRGWKAWLDSWYDEFFSACDDPAVPGREVEIALMHRAFDGERPTLTRLEKRDACDPRSVAGEIFEHDLGERARSELIKGRYSAIAHVIYPELRLFRAAVDDALWERHHPELAPQPKAVPVFEPPTDLPLAKGPHHDLDKLLDEVLSAAPGLLGLGKKPRWKITAAWSPRLLKGWYAKATWQPDDRPGGGWISVNCLLNSPDVPAELLRFLLWHELLHLHLRAGHTPLFRELERAWPSALEGDRFLDTLNEQWCVQYW